MAAKQQRKKKEEFQPDLLKEIWDRILSDLLAQLEQKGLTQEFYKSLVDDYMAMWITKEALFFDIQQRGVVVKYNNGGGQSGYKKNESVAEMTKVNAAMLKILTELGLRGVDVKPKDEEETL